jgi:UDP:flavonoid glycosyltransferase YjiC (YdhE family)
LRAGVPSLVIPFAGDQFFWGRRVFELGVGPRPIPRRELSVENLADGIRLAVRKRSFHERALALGMDMRAEGGVYRAVDALERSFGGCDLRVRSDSRPSIPHRSPLDPRAEPALLAQQ